MRSEHFLEWKAGAGCLRSVAMKYAVLAFGLWLAGAQGFVTQVCSPDMPSSKADCGGCDNQAGRDSSPNLGCCVSDKAQKDVDAAVPKNDLPEKPAPVEFVTLDTSAASRPEATDIIDREAARRAEGPPLYLRYAVLLI